VPRRESLGLDASNADHIDESRTRLIIIGAMVDEWTRLFKKEISRVMSLRRKKPRLCASMASNRPDIWDNDKVKGRVIPTEEDLLIPSPATLPNKRCPHHHDRMSKEVALPSWFRE
jgi:hypothetical protein